MKKRLLSGLLAAVLCLALLPAAAFAAAPAEDEAAQALAALDIMVGDADGNLNLGSTVTRAEFTKMAVAASQWKDTVGPAASVSPYPDVPKSHWAAPWVQAAVSANLVSGYLDGTFRPSSQITLAEGVTIVLRLLGYGNSDFTGAYPAGQMAMYASLKLNEGVSATQNSSMTRRDALYLFYNLLTAKTKAGQYYLNTIQSNPNLVGADGKLDMVALVNSAMEGPVVAETGWQSQVPFDVNSAKVYRAGAASSLSAIQDLDVIYWSDSMRTLWAYNTRVTGTYEKAAPSAAAPTSVVVAGKTYAIESTSAAWALSDLGSYRVGDSVTLLLGRTGGVAAVRGGGVSASSTVYGVVTAVSSGTYDDGKGGTYTADMVSILTTTGAQYDYQAQSKYFKTGDMVRVSSGDGETAVKRVSSTALSGKVNADATKLGSYPIASDAGILDTYGDVGVQRIFPARLAGMNLTSDMVRFYALNAQGEIEHLILKDATGDVHQYGVLTDVTEINGDMTAAGSYTYDVGGVSVEYPSPNKLYGAHKGPVQILSKDGKTVDRFVNLTEVKLESAEGNTALSDANRKYTLSDAVAVYEVRDGEYYYSSLSRVNGGGFTLTGWYDKDESQGGRIRVILATADK
ncbi:hypothetical protein CE91St41_05390 [Oscillospiraceae bacterium]|nr:hypothetical protein CE91St40_05390 [Oscillospiraceae bacterium]BDF73650.1 hypothetical protein CE91St41_05390 [Oscillospiraceae bacterium]